MIKKRIFLAILGIIIFSNQSLQSGYRKKKAAQRKRLRLITKKKEKPRKPKVIKKEPIVRKVPVIKEFRLPELSPDPIVELQQLALFMEEAANQNRIWKLSQFEQLSKKINNTEKKIKKQIPEIENLKDVQENRKKEVFRAAKLVIPAIEKFKAAMKKLIEFTKKHRSQRADDFNDIINALKVEIRGKNKLNQLIFDAYGTYLQNYVIDLLKKELTKSNKEIKRLEKEAQGNINKMAEQEFKEITEKQKKRLRELLRFPQPDIKREEKALKKMLLINTLFQKQKNAPTIELRKLKKYEANAAQQFGSITTKEIKEIASSTFDALKNAALIIRKKLLAADTRNPLGRLKEIEFDLTTQKKFPAKKIIDTNIVKFLSDIIPEADGLVEKVASSQRRQASELLQKIKNAAEVIKGKMINYLKNKEKKFDLLLDELKKGKQPLVNLAESASSLTKQVKKVNPALKKAMKILFEETIKEEQGNLEKTIKNVQNLARLGVIGPDEVMFTLDDTFKKLAQFSPKKAEKKNNETERLVRNLKIKQREQKIDPVTTQFNNIVNLAKFKLFNLNQLMQELQPVFEQAGTISHGFKIHLEENAKIIMKEGFKKIIKLEEEEIKLEEEEIESEEEEGEEEAPEERIILPLKRLKKLRLTQIREQLSAGTPQKAVLAQMKGLARTPLQKQQYNEILKNLKDENWFIEEKFLQIEKVQPLPVKENQRNRFAEEIVKKILQEDADMKKEDKQAILAPAKEWGKKNPGEYNLLLETLNDMGFYEEEKPLAVEKKILPPSIKKAPTKPKVKRKYVTSLELRDLTKLLFADDAPEQEILEEMKQLRDKNRQQKLYSSSLEELVNMGFFAKIPRQQLELEAIKKTLLKPKDEREEKIEEVIPNPKNMADVYHQLQTFIAKAKKANPEQAIELEKKVKKYLNKQGPQAKGWEKESKANQFFMLVSEFQIIIEKHKKGGVL